MTTKEYNVTENIELLPFLAKIMPDASRTKLKEILAHNVAVDGRRVSQFNFPLQPGMQVAISKNSPQQRFRSNWIDIVFEDHFLLVVNKREGILSNSKNVKDITVISELNRYLSVTHQRCTAHIVHRLDRDTSGLMVVAKNRDVAQKFEEDWKGTVDDRAYVAVAWGDIEKRQGIIQSWLTDGEFCVLSSPTDNGGKLAITHYEVVKKSRRYSLVELRLDTGRRNQIRVHLRELGHPVVHDPLYGYKDDISPIHRLALHAFRLGFTHPITHKRHTFNTEYPASFLKLMEL